MTKHSNATISAANKTKAWISTLLDSKYTWREIGAELGVSASIAWQFHHHGFIPKKNSLRVCLGLPMLCPRCGEEVT